MPYYSCSFIPLRPGVLPLRVPHGLCQNPTSAGIYILIVLQPAPCVEVETLELPVVGDPFAKFSSVLPPQDCSQTFAGQTARGSAEGLRTGALHTGGHHHFVARGTTQGPVPRMPVSVWCQILQGCH